MSLTASVFNLFACNSFEEMHISSYPPTESWMDQLEVIILLIVPVIILFFAN